MTTSETMKRNEKANNLKVFQSDEGVYLVESSEGKIPYRVDFKDHNAASALAWIMFFGFLPFVAAQEGEEVRPTRLTNCCKVTSSDAVRPWTCS